MARRPYVTGVDDVRRAFRQMTEESVQDMAGAITRGVVRIERSAKLLAPRDDEDDEHMADEIAHRVRITAGGRGVTGTVFVGLTEATRQAALRSEFGRGPGGAGMEGHPGHDPQAFFFRAYQAERKRVLGGVRRAIGRAAKRSAVIRRGSR